MNEGAQCTAGVTLTRCGSDDDCGKFEVCSLSAHTGANICVGCKALDDSRFAPLDPYQRKCEATRPACGKTLDLCSEDLPCDAGFDCVFLSNEDANGKEYECVPEGPCQCLPAKGQLEKCATSDECPSQEICATNVVNNIKFCASCQAVRNDRTLIVDEKENAKCGDVETYAPPYYAPSSNGLSYDLCSDDVQCAGSRTCVRFRRKEKPEDGVMPCEPSGSGLCFCKEADDQGECATSSACPTGEACTDVPRLLAKRKCISLGVLAALPQDASTVHGEPAHAALEEGTNMTGDPCRFDWDCRSPRRCTHPTGAFGGCAGRRACTCEPLTCPPCLADASCDEGEACVRTAGGKSDLRCVSAAVVTSTESLWPPAHDDAESQASLSATLVPGDGLVGAPCREDADCSRDALSCQHSEEWGPGCAGRPSCVCKHIVSEDGQLREVHTPCEETADCSQGEVCTAVVDAVPQTPFCLSRYAFQLQPDKFEEIGL